MKYTITNGDIELKHLLYRIIIPNGQSFKCSFIDNRKIVGNFDHQVGLLIDSEKKQYKPWYGIILNFFNYFFIEPSASPVPGDIYGLKKIENFLIEARDKGYNVSDVLGEVALAKQEKITFFGK